MREVTYFKCIISVGIKVLVKIAKFKTREILKGRNHGLRKTAVKMKQVKYM